MRAPGNISTFPSQDCSPFPLDSSYLALPTAPTNIHPSYSLAMCQVPTYTSPIAVSQPSTYSECCPIIPAMSNRSSFDRYLSMDASSVNLIQTAPVVLRSQHFPYYATIGLVLVSIWLYQSIQASNITKVKVPYYKASILKWYFDAESLVRDSYSKVRMRSSTRQVAVLVFLTRASQFHDQVYQIKATEGIQVLIPAKFLGELKGLPEDVLSATEAVSEVRSSPPAWPTGLASRRDR